MSQKSLINTEQILHDLHNTPFIGHLTGANPIDIYVNILGISGILFTFVLACFLLLSISIHLLSKIEQFGTKNYQLKISFDTFGNYHEGYSSIMVNFLNGLRSSIKNSIHNFEIIKREGAISYNLYCNDFNLLQSLQRNLESIDGLQTELLVNQENTEDQIEEDIYVQTIHSKQSIVPIQFNESNSLTHIVKILENVDNGGFLITFRGCSQTHNILQKIKSYKKLQTLEKNKKREIYKSKIIQLENKIQYGELFIVKLFSFSTNKSSNQSISNSVASSFSNQQTKIRNCIFNPKKQILDKYLYPDTLWFRDFPRKYNYMNSVELAHYFFPTISNQQKQLHQNNVQIGTADNIFEFNQKGDSLSFSSGTLNKICFGDPNSGKSSAYMASEIQAAFNFDVGIISTVYKQEEANLLIHLAVQNGRENDLIVLTKSNSIMPSSKWQTNIIETELKSSLSIKNIINLFNVINRAVEGNNANTKDEPFWERSNNELQNAIIRLMLILYGTFSLTQMLELSILANDYANSFELETPTTPSQFTKLLQIARETLDNNEVWLYGKLLDIGQIRDFILGIDYFNRAFIHIPSKQRDSLLTVYRSIINYCNSGIIRDKLFADITPENPNWFDFESTREGKIIILDIPKETEGIEGQIFQIISKIAWQQSMLRSQGKHVYFISDEFQEFATASDSKFLSANRSYKVHNILATQNYKGLELALGKVAADDLLEKCQTKLFFKTSAIETINYAQKLIGEDVYLSSAQSLGSQFSSSTTHSIRTPLLPKYFQSLSDNIPLSQAECIIFSQGRIWKQNNKPYLILIFNKIAPFKLVPLVKLLPEQFQAGNKMYQNSMKQEDHKIGGNTFIKPTKNSVEVINNADIYLTVKQATLQFPIEKSRLYNLLKKQKLKTIDGKPHKGKPTKLVSKEDLEVYFNV